MEPQVNHDTVTVSPPETVTVVEQTPVGYEHVVASTAPTHVDRVDSYSSIAPHALVAGLLAIGMLVWGGVAMARAGFDDPMRLPIISVGGFVGNAISGAIVAGIGVVLLLAAVSRDRGAILFISIVTGVAALIAAMEPGMGDNVFGIDSDLPVVIAIACGVVVLVATVLPTVNRTSRTIDRV
jgi:hypothetical protein